MSQTGLASEKQLVETAIDKIVTARSKSSIVPTCLFLVATGSFLYSLLFIPPFLPLADKCISDSFLYLAPGQRMYQGEMIYKDFFEFVPPGTALVHLLLFKLFGLRLWVPDSLALLLGLGLVWIGLVISRNLMRPGLALLPSSLFLVKARTFLCNPVHHWYSQLAGMAGIAVLMERRTPARIAAAGMFCGLSACFTQTRGVAVAMGIALFLGWEATRLREGWSTWLKKESWLITSFFITLLAVNVYFIGKAGIARFLWCTVVFALKYYPQEADWNSLQVLALEFPRFATEGHEFYRALASWCVLYVVYPFVFILFFVRYWKQRLKKPVEYWARPMLVAIVGVFMFLSIAPSPSSTRMETAALPMFILLCWHVESFGRAVRPVAALLAFGVIAVALSAVVGRLLNPAVILATTHGKIGLTDPTSNKEYEEYVWIGQQTQPMEYFYEADFSEIYFFLNLRNPTTQPRITNNGYTTVEQVQEVISGLQQHQVRFILWRPDALDEPPGWDSPSGAHLGPLRDYIHSHYRLVKIFANSDEIWELI